MQTLFKDAWFLQLKNKNEFNTFLTVQIYHSFINGTFIIDVYKNSVYYSVNTSAIQPSLDILYLSYAIYLKIQK